MHAAPDTLNLTPPPPPGMVRALGLALLAHALLLAALAINMQWKQTESATVEAELWSSSVQMAAPKAVNAPPPSPVEAPRPVPTPPQPVAKVQPQPAPDVKDADIALERAKKKREAEKLEQVQQAKADKAKRDKLQLEKDKQEALKVQKAEVAAELADKKRAEDKRAKDKKVAQDRQDALDKKTKATQDAKDAAKDDAQKAKVQADAKALAALHDANVKKMLASAAGVSGANGAANATGSALQSSGPSAGYGGKVVAKVKPNIVFPDDFEGNPKAEIEIRLSPDGTILSNKLVKPSGNKAWDDAVLKAIDKTQTMPRDTDGRVPSSMIIGFKPRDF